MLLGAFPAVPLLLFLAYLYAAAELWWSAAAYFGAALALAAALRVIVPRVFGRASDSPSGTNA